MVEYINRILVRSSWPLIFKYLSLIALILFLVSGFQAHSTDSSVLRHLRNTNFGNLMVWSYWWPAIILLAIVFGRIWCMVCPVEIITTFAAKIGFKKKRPLWLKSGWAITLFYTIILLVGMQVLAIHRNPFYMSVYLLSIILVSVIIGIIYEKNTFCRYVCPVGYLLGLYSRLAFWGWRVKEPSVCNSCTDKSCIHKKYTYHLNSKSCGVDLYPAKIVNNDHCILCAGCLKACDRFQSEVNPQRPNPGLKYVGFANGLFRLKPLNMAEMTFLLLVSGFVISQVYVEWSVTSGILNSISSFLISPFSVESHAWGVFWHGVIIFAMLPVLIWFIPWLGLRIGGGRMGLKSYLLNYGIAFLPIMAAAHLSKSIVKAVSRLPYFQHLSKDWSGVETANQILDGSIVLWKVSPLAELAISVIITIFISAGIYLSGRIVYLLNRKNSIQKMAVSFYLIPVLYGGIFWVMIMIWRWF
ncbi:4Fe-4S binding protein [Alkalitalea saponilacus]|uniref:4Fe-4S binding domain-containing protein n=1 Tax=Alkalitalea saponilacus TaxID=889453 RepID=A0A1T5HQX7_9BACT|nr:4Fe-4S binding protein [Alkalitalea saponilacus]ASB48414.1 hypothetical protein CDL62_04305 [Alkalitalea saponilacus]SKC23017.1 4Fe-4S binding domain-containing protein [Alkalitalea saponilacus]